jgi:hypothetical protein
MGDTLDEREARELEEVVVADAVPVPGFDPGWVCPLTDYRVADCLCASCRALKGVL